MSEENKDSLIENVSDLIAPEAQLETAQEPIKEETLVEELASELNIDAKITEVEESALDNNVITAPSFPASTVPSMGVVEQGVIGSTKSELKPKKSENKKSEKKADTVAIYSTKNVTWSGVGKVYRGYNIVEKSAADKWLTRSHVRIATPEEVALEFKK